MNYEEAAIELLATEENLSIALEITDIISKWKVSIHKSFWKALHQNLSRKLAESNQGQHWRVDYPGTSLSKYRKDYFSCRIAPIRHTKGKQYFSFILQQGRADNDYRLHYGISRRNPEYTNQESGIEEIQKLARLLQADGFEDDGGWFLGRKYLDIRLMGSDTLLRLATDMDGFVEDTARIVWNLFEKHIYQIEVIHQILAAEQIAD